MKKLIFLLFMSNILYINVCHALVTGNTAWEFLSTATAGNVNGGGFDNSIAGGVDGSRGADCILNMSDLVVGAAGNTFTSVLTPVLSTHTGNVVRIISGAGCTVGWHGITDAAGSIGTTVSSLGTAASVCVAKIGGALSWNSTFDDDITEVWNSSNTIYFKAGSYSNGETVTMSTDAASGEIRIIGYQSTRGDTPMGDSRPEMNSGAGNVVLAGDGLRIENMRFTTTGTNGLNVGSPSTLLNCEFRNTSASALRDAFRGGQGTKVLRSDFSSYNGNALVSSLALAAYIGNYIHHSSYGFVNGGNTGRDFLAFNLFETFGSSAISYLGISPSIHLLYNTIVSTPVGKFGTCMGHSFQTPNSNHIIQGNIFANCSTVLNMRHGMYGAGFSGNIYDNNNFFNYDVLGSSNVFLGPNNYFLDPQFTDPAQHNYRVGTNMKGIGIPGGFSTTISTGFPDLGAVQRLEPTGGSGGTRSFSFTQ